MNLSSRSLLAATVTLAVAVAAGFVFQQAATFLMLVGAVGAVASLVAGACPPPEGIEQVKAALERAGRGQRVEQVSRVSSSLVPLLETARDLSGTVEHLMERDQERKKLIETVRSALSDLHDGREPAAREQLQRYGLWGEMRSLLSLYQSSSQRSGSRLDERSVEEYLDEVDSSAGATEKLASQVRDNAERVGDWGRGAAKLLEVLSKASEESSSDLETMVDARRKLRGDFENLLSQARETGTSIEEMAFSIQEVAKNVEALSLTAEETSSSMNEIDVSIGQVETNAKATAQLSEKVTHDAEQGGRAIMKTIEEIQRIEESTSEAVDVIGRLGTRIETISEILGVIEDVAEQTNLLALNAAIIAAQAGEHGKGFAVVADEIKDLAERAGDSTREIAELTKTIRSESRNAIEAVKRGAENVKRGVMVSNEAEQALKQILESSRKSTSMMQTIARATLEQANGTRQVTDAMGTIARTVQQIATTTSEQAKSSEFVMRAVETIRDISFRVEQTEREQDKAMGKLVEGLTTVDETVRKLEEKNVALREAMEEVQLDADKIRQQARKQRSTADRLRQECRGSGAR